MRSRPISVVVVYLLLSWQLAAEEYYDQDIVKPAAAAEAFDYDDEWSSAGNSISLCALHCTHVQLLSYLSLLSTNGTPIGPKH